MIYLLLVLVVINLLGFIGLVYFFRRKIQEMSDKGKNDQSLLLLNQNLQGMHDRLDRAAQVIGQVNKELGGMKEIGHQLQSFQDFLRSPKMRGNIGEQILQDLLEQYFSKNHFELQYKFRSGERVDAVLKTSEGLIPIDAKFPLESFQRYLAAKDEEEGKQLFKDCIKSVKARIDEINKKYILPDEGTVDFAIMYIPSETVYYEIIRSPEQIDDYARQKRVYFVSPNSFYYFLRIVMVGMRGQQIGEETKKMINVLLAVQKDSEKLGEILGIVTTHINNAKNAIDRANNDYGKLTGKLDQIKLLK